MFWSSAQQYRLWPFEREAELEAAILDARADLFGELRLYLDIRTLLGVEAKGNAAPDAFLIDLSSRFLPTLYLVEIELAVRDPLRHVAQQLLDFDLSARSAPQRLRSALRQAVQRDPRSFGTCEAYAAANGFPALDGLLDELIHPDALRALVIVDAVGELFEPSLRGALKLPIEILTFRRFRSSRTGDVLYDFEPFMQDLPSPTGDDPDEPAAGIDPAELDTIVIRAPEDGFSEVFLGEAMWRPVRIHDSLLSQIRFVAGFQAAPISAITHVAEVDRIEPYEGSYAIYFKGPAQKMGPIESGPDRRGLLPAGNCYTSFARLCRAHTLEEIL
jgi:hypothetical protein